MQHGFGSDYEDVIQRYPVSQPAEQVSVFNLRSDINNHRTLNNNRAANVNDSEDGVDF